MLLGLSRDTVEVRARFKLIWTLTPITAGSRLGGELCVISELFELQQYPGLTESMTAYESDLFHQWAAM